MMDHQRGPWIGLVKLVSYCWLFWNTMPGENDVVTCLAFSEDSLTGLAEKLGARLQNIVKTASGFDEIEKGFTSLNVKITDIDPASDLKTIGEKLSRMVHQKVEAVELLVDFAEETARGHECNPEINITYNNAKEPDGSAGGTYGFNRIDFGQDSRFYNDPVNLHCSTVHVPTNIFSRSISVQNGVTWTKKLDHLFQYNLLKDPQLRSQYFCSSDGFQRMYPGVKWKLDPEKPDMYDCRMSSWFVRAVSSPKDIIILLDISGSMTGVRQDWARKTVIEIMGTLTEDDFFNIITFQKNATFLDPCLNNTLIQASDKYKKRMTQLLLGLKTRDFANYTVALPVAFQLLSSVREVHRTTNCNAAIMIITDNAPEIFEDIMQIYNPDRHIRIFGYIMGREVTEYEYMTEMACNNRGSVAHIKTTADIRDYVEEYYQIMGRPMAPFGNHTNAWSPAHWQPRNILGMVVTASQPVFNRSSQTDPKGRLIGVVGVDLPTEDFVRLMTPHKWGVGSYVFGVNHNGHVVFHPRWKTMPNGEYPIPIQNEVNLSELELDSEGRESDEFAEEVRNKMIDKKTGTYRMKKIRQLDGQRRVYEKEYQYYFTDVQGSPYSVGIAIPVGENSPPPPAPKASHGTRRPRQADSLVFHNTKWEVHPQWFYCNITASKFANLSVFLEDLLVKGDLPPDALDLSCDKELLESLMFDAKATQAAGDHWVVTNKNQVDLYDHHGITTCFTSTRAGLTRWKILQDTGGPLGRYGVSNDTYFDDPFSNTSLINDTVINGTTSAAHHLLTTRHYFEAHAKAVDEAWYERTVQHGSAITVTAIIPADQKSSYDSIMLSVPVFVGQSGAKTVPVAVSGIFMYTVALTDLILEISKESCKLVGECVSCDSPLTECYLLDESGYVVTDTHNSENVGKFFGNLRSEIMEDLVDRDIYKRYDISDSQGICTPPIRQKRSAGNSRRPWVGSLLTSLGMLIERTISFLSFAINFVLAVAEEPLYFWYEPKNSSGIPERVYLTNPPYKCDARYSLFHSTWKGHKMVFDSTCQSNCTKSIGIFKVISTNLLLLAMDSAKSCLCNDAHVTTEPAEAQYDSGEICAKYADFPYRRRPKDCFSYYKDEVYSECGRPFEPYSPVTESPCGRSFQPYGVNRNTAAALHSESALIWTLPVISVSLFFRMW